VAKLHRVPLIVLKQCGADCSLIPYGTASIEAVAHTFIKQLLSIIISPTTDYRLPTTAIRVEFYGIPRERAGVAATTADGGSLGELLADLGARFPRLAESCLAGNRLRPEYAANLNGARFVTSPETKLAPGDVLLVLSADAGG